MPLTTTAGRTVSASASSGMFLGTGTGTDVFSRR